MGKGRSSPKIKSPQLSKEGHAAERIYTGAISRALDMRGFLPKNLKDMNAASMKNTLTSSFNDVISNLGSSLNPSVRKDDARVRSHMTDMVKRARNRSVYAVDESARDQDYQDYVMGQDLGGQEVAASENMGLAVKNIYEQGASTLFGLEQQYGTMAENIGGGMGSFAGWMGARQEYARIASGGGV